MSNILRITPSSCDVLMHVGANLKRIGADDFAIYSSAQPYAYFNDGDGRVRFVRNVLR